MNGPDLPPDLVEFLRSGRSLNYDPTEAEPGAVVMRTCPPLITLWVDSSDRPWHASDPHAGEVGYYAVPVVDLIADCEGFDPAGVLVWIPREQAFGTWDADHWDLIVFRDVLWSHIEADPIPYLNAQWTGDVGKLLVPVNTYEFVQGRPF